MTDEDKDKIETTDRDPKDEPGVGIKGAPGGSVGRCPKCQMPRPHHLPGCSGP